jgi:hypothetical protein
MPHVFDPPRGFCRKGERSKAQIPDTRFIHQGSVVTVADCYKTCIQMSFAGCEVVPREKNNVLTSASSHLSDKKRREGGAPVSFFADR